MTGVGSGSSANAARNSLAFGWVTVRSANAVSRAALASLSCVRADAVRNASTGIPVTSASVAHLMLRNFRSITARCPGLGFGGCFGGCSGSCFGGGCGCARVISPTISASRIGRRAQLFISASSPCSSLSRRSVNRRCSATVSRLARFTVENASHGTPSSAANSSVSNPVLPNSSGGIVGRNRLRTSTVNGVRRTAAAGSRRAETRGCPSRPPGRNGSGG